MVILLIFTTTNTFFNSTSNECNLIVLLKCTLKFNNNESCVKATDSNTEIYEDQHLMALYDYHQKFSNQENLIARDIVTSSCNNVAM